MLTFCIRHDLLQRGNEFSVGVRQVGGGHGNKPRRRIAPRLSNEIVLQIHEHNLCVTACSEQILAAAVG